MAWKALFDRAELQQDGRITAFVRFQDEGGAEDVRTYEFLPDDKFSKDALKTKVIADLNDMNDALQKIVRMNANLNGTDISTW
jgi:hypothetical protein